MTCSNTKNTKKQCSTDGSFNFLFSLSCIIFVFTCSLCNPITALELVVADGENPISALEALRVTRNSPTLINDIMLTEDAAKTFIQRKNRGTKKDRQLWSETMSEKSLESVSESVESVKRVMAAAANLKSSYCESVCKGETNKKNCRKHGVQHSSQIMETCTGNGLKSGDGKSCVYDKRFKTFDSCTNFCERMMGTACRRALSSKSNKYCYKREAASCSTANRYICECEVPTCTCCTPGRSSNNGVNQYGGGCTACVSGKYQDQNGQSSCKSCTRGTYSNQTERSICKSCTRGTYNDQTEQSSCKSCDQGKWSNDLGRTTDCAQCDKGKYNDQIAQFECKNCDAGKHNMGTQKTNVKDCVLCEVGTYNDATGLGDACFQCPKATTKGETSCDACLPGTFRAATCVDCPAGQFTYEIDQPSCSKCPAGYHAKDFSKIDDVKRKRHDGCTGCPRGKYGTSEESIDEAAACIECIAGRFSDLEALSTTHLSDGVYCSPCASGKWNDQKGCVKESECMNCNAGRYSTTIASSLKSNCVDCNKGTYLKFVGADKEIINYNYNYAYAYIYIYHI